MTPSPEQPHTLPSTHSLNEETPLLDPAPLASIHSPALSASTPSSLFVPTPDPLHSSQLAPAPLLPPAPRPSSEAFGPGITEALPYATTGQAPYPLPVAPLTDKLAATAKATVREILIAPSILSFLASKQRKTLRGLPKGVMYLAADLILDYIEDGIPAHTGSPWFPQSLETAISVGPHASACTPVMAAYIRGRFSGG